MTEKKMTYVGGFSLEDFFEDQDDVLLGAGGVFTVCSLSRVFTVAGSSKTASLLLNNLDDPLAVTTGYAIIAGPGGGISVLWGDGATSQTLVVSTTNEPMNSGPTALVHVRFDAPNDSAELWIDGTLSAIETAPGSGIVPSVGGTPTRVGVLPVNASSPFPGGGGIAGLAIFEGLMTDQQISEHYNAVAESEDMADIGIFAALWDCRTGLPAAGPETTQWLDEVTAASLERQVTTPTLFSEAARPRFQ